MVVTIDGNWSNGTLRTSVSNLEGATTKGFRTLEDGIFYCEILSENSTSYKGIGVATTLNQSWIGYGAFTNALYPIPHTSVTIGSTYGILLDLTGSVGKFSWNKDGGGFSDWADVIDSKGNIIRDFRIAIVGSSSGGGTQYFTLNYNVKTFKTKHSDILNMAKGDVYTFDGSDKLHSEKILLKANDMFYSPNSKTYSLESIDIVYETNMTSNTAPSPLVASASSEYNANYQAWKAFNGTINVNQYDYWCTNNIPTGWVQMKFDIKKTINTISLTSSGTTLETTKGTPKNFNILASNDGVAFTKLGEFRNQTNWNIAETRDFTFINVTPYQYYRVEVLNNNGAIYVSIGEILLTHRRNALYLLPTISEQVFVSYGKRFFRNLSIPIESKNYILQDVVSENSEGLYTTKLDRKPLSIGFN